MSRSSIALMTPRSKQEIRQMTVGWVVASGRAYNLLGRRGIPGVTVP
jgi:hypothetical protein